MLDDPSIVSKKIQPSGRCLLCETQKANILLNVTELCSTQFKRKQESQDCKFKNLHILSSPAIK